MRKMGLSLLVLIRLTAGAQVGINNNNPDASAELDVKSSTRGFLAPRMSGAQMNAIAAPATGLAVYNTDSASYCIYTGSAWQKVLLSAASNWTASGSDLYNSNSGNVGVGTATPASRLHMDGGNLLVTGTVDGSPDYQTEVGGNIDPNTPYTNQPTLFFNTGLGALRAGRILGTEWSNANVGYYSTALGYGVRASGTYSFAAGFKSIAANTSSVALGEGCYASGYASVALGYYAHTNARLGAFVFSDRSNGIGSNTDNSSFYGENGPQNNFKATVNNSFNVRAAGGYYLYSDASASTDNGLFFKSGNLGIGVSAPASKLEVNGSLKAGTLQLTTGAGTGYLLVSDAAGNANWTPSYNIFAPGWNTSGSVVYYTSGNVGIGTASPGTALDVAGTTRTTGFRLSTGSAAGYVLQSDASGQASWVNPTTIANGNWTTSGSNQYSALSGNVGIGTTTPSVKLEVSGALKATSLAAGTMQLTTGATSGYVLQSDASGNASWVSPTSFSSNNWTTSGANQYSALSGNVGIGTTTPAAKLDVNGSLKSTSTQTGTLQLTTGAASGRVLQSDASGNASWVSPTTLSVTESDPKVGSLTSNKTPRWNGSTLADGSIYDNGTAVAIGTTSIPSESSLVLGAQSGSTIEGGQLQLNGAGPFGAQFIDNYNGMMRFLRGTNSAASSVSMNISAAGNLGVNNGNLSAASTFEVNGSVGYSVRSGLTAGNTQPDNSASVYLFSSASATPIILPTASTCSYRMYTLVNQTGSAISISTYYDLGNTAKTTIASKSSIQIVSDGLSWYQIR